MIQAILTIDDIPSRNTPAIVDYLREKDIQAILFAWGERISQYPEEAAYAVQQGMIVGNHGWSHPLFSKLSLEECIREIEQCEEALNALYASAGVERVYRPFRFPYGEKGGANREAIQQYLAAKGFHKVNDRAITAPWWKAQGLDREIDTFWTFDFAEYQIRPDSGFTKDDVLKRIFDRNPPTGSALLEDGSSHIILLHAHDETEELVPAYWQQFVDCAIENGVTFIPPSFL